MIDPLTVPVSAQPPPVMIEAFLLDHEPVSFHEEVKVEPGTENFEVHYTALMETASDDWLVDFNNDGVAEVAIGRLPFRTTGEAAAMVAKLTAYERSAPSEEVVLSAAAAVGYSFENDSDRLRRWLPDSLRVNAVYRGRMNADEAKAVLMNAINRGQRLVNYVGHGSVDQWRGNLLTDSDGLKMTNREGLSVFVLMTCLNGYYDDPALDSLAPQ